MDPRYVRVEGKPLFTLYNPDELPDPERVTDLWRELAVRAGLPGLFLIAEHSPPEWDPKKRGFDAVVLVRLPPRRHVLDSRIPWTNPRRKLRLRFAQWRGLPTIHKYEEVLNHLMPDPVPGIESFPCVIPNWDNTPRSGTTGMVLHGSTPELFRMHLRKALQRTLLAPSERRLVFVKSWNEWAEGNHLEPDLRYGRGYLEVIREELEQANASA